MSFHDAVFSSRGGTRCKFDPRLQLSSVSASVFVLEAQNRADATAATEITRSGLHTTESERDLTGLETSARDTGLLCNYIHRVSVTRF